MTVYRHFVSGFFSGYDEAERTRATLVEHRLMRDRIYVFATDSEIPVASLQSDSNNVLKDVLVDGVIGSVVGTGLGVVAELGLVAANVSLFVASPLLAPLILMGWGASLGGFIGASVGATEGDGHKKGMFSDLVADAISNGQVVLVVDTQNEAETTIARDIIQAAVGDFKDANAA